VREREREGGRERVAVLRMERILKRGCKSTREREREWQFSEWREF
jgi:hypothetical protein